MTEIMAGQLSNSEIGRRVQIIATSGAVITDELAEVNHLKDKVWVSLINTRPGGLDQYNFHGSAGFWVDPASIVEVEE